MTREDVEITTTPVSNPPAVRTSSAPLNPITVLSISFYGMQRDDDRLDDVVNLVAGWAEGQDVRKPVFTAETYPAPERS